MAENNMMNLKIFLKDDNTSEARRILVDASVATSFLFMKEKLQTVFPNLRNSSFKITWSDVDGDEITIASDEDFITAFTEMSGNVKILTVTVLQRSTEPGIYVCAAPEAPRTPVIICDACDKKISGFRYKCLQCPDYDLCADCEFQSHHSNHVMVRLPNNETYSSKCARKFMHHIARNLKKSAHCANKDAHRAAKYASKYGGRCKQNNDNSSAEEDYPPPRYQPSCPFMAKDAQEFGSLAQQKLSEILKPMTTQSGTEPKDQGAALFDVLRNVVDGFFGHCPQNVPTNDAQPESNISEGSKKSSENHSSPMDTEVCPSAPLYPVLSASNGQGTKTDSQPMPATDPKPTPEVHVQPEWTFVASNNQAQNNTAVAPQETQPRVEFIYHANPIIAEGLVKLHEMGFSNESGILTHLLEHFNGNVAEVVKAYLETYS